MKRCCCGKLARVQPGGKLCSRCARPPKVAPGRAFEISESETQAELFAEPEQPRTHSQGMVGKKK